MSGSGFTDDPRSALPRSTRKRRDRQTQEAQGDSFGRSGRGSDAGRPSGQPARRSGRSGRTVVGFGLVIVALGAFGAWSWTSRAHNDDVAAFATMSQQLAVMDRRITPQRHGELAPCRDGVDGTITRTYPPSRPPAVIEVVAYLGKQGWSEVTATPPAAARLVTTAAGLEQTVEVFGPDRFGPVSSLTATSPGSAVGCFLR